MIAIGVYDLLHSCRGSNIRVASTSLLHSWLALRMAAVKPSHDLPLSKGLLQRRHRITSCTFEDAILNGKLNSTTSVIELAGHGEGGPFVSADSFQSQLAFGRDNLYSDYRILLDSLPSQSTKLEGSVRTRRYKI